MQLFDLKLTGGTVIDPANNRCDPCDVAVGEGKIAQVAPTISGEARHSIDATGCIVTPGLIDHHIHLYPLISNGVPAEAVCFASGVTTAVDAGSTGSLSIELHDDFFRSSLLDIKAYLHVNSKGLSGLPELEDVSPESINVEGIRHALSVHGDRLLGLKLRTSKEIVGRHGLRPLEKCLSIASDAGVPVMVHITNPPGPMDDILRMLRPGDILTHMYQNVGYTILNEAGQVSGEAWKARERGVLFEAADARAHFSFQVAKQAVQQGFLPDIISTDLTAFSMLQRPTAFNLAMQLSKYAALGIPLADVIKACTQTPAKLLGTETPLGTLTAGRQADIAVFRPVQMETQFGDRPYYDNGRTMMPGSTLYQPVLTVKKGKLVYRDITF